MIKKTVTYVTYTGESRTRDLYFHLTKAKLMDHLYLKDRFESATKMLQGEKRDLKDEETYELLQLIKLIINLSYGERSEDGEYFRQTEEIQRNFLDSPAYDAMLWQLFENPAQAVSFLGEVMPADLMEEAQKQMEPKAPQDRLQKKAPVAKAEKFDDDKVVGEETPEERKARLQAELDALG